MLIISSAKEKDPKNVERLVRKYKRKFDRTRLGKEVRRRMAYQKPSVKRRKVVLKAIYTLKYKLREGLL